MGPLAATENSGSGSGSSSGGAGFQSVLPLEASISDIALRVVQEVLEPILAPHARGSPPSPFVFTHLRELRECLSRRMAEASDPSSPANFRAAECQEPEEKSDAFASSDAHGEEDADSLKEKLDSRLLLGLLPHGVTQLGPESLNELSEAVCASFNTTQLPAPSERRRLSGVPQDGPYDTNYREWLEFLKIKQPTGASLSAAFGRSMLRSLLLCRASSLLRDIKGGPLGFCCDSIFDRLADEAGLTRFVAREALKATPTNCTSSAESMLVSASGLGFLTRDSGSALEERNGLLSFACLTNDRQPFSSMGLITAKNIFARQLPKMPREYIVRLVFDRNHYTFCLLKKDTIIGGCCFRPYFQQKFAEVAFLAVTSTEQVKGYGTRLMNHLKEHVKRSGIEYFLTYADNFAVGYFRKQGFTQKISLAREKWFGFIKDYEGGTLMECRISPRVDYLRLAEMLQRQQQAVHEAIFTLKPPKVFPGLDCWEKDPSRVLAPLDVPGVEEFGWSEKGATAQPAAAHVSALPLHEQIYNCLEVLTKHHSSWPFQRPVNREEAPDYYDVIQNPTDIQTMKKKAKKKQFPSKAAFIAELRRMFENCRRYNGQLTIYYKYADELEKFILPKAMQIQENPR